MSSDGSARDFRASLRTLSAALGVLLFLSVAVPADAVPPPPPNPSDQQIEDSQSTANSSAAEVGRLSGLVTRTQGDITRLRNDLETKGELYKKSLVDLSLAQADAGSARKAAGRAAVAAARAGGAIASASDAAAKFAAASFRQGSVLGSMTALMDVSSANDLLQRQQLLNAVSSSQLDVIGHLQSTRNEKVNLDSDANLAQDAAQAAAARAAQANLDAQQAKKTATDAFTAGQAQLAALNTRLDQQQNDYQLALSKVANLKDQRAQYNQWLAAKRAEEERIRQEALARARRLAAERAAAEKAAEHARQVAAAQAAAERAAQARADAENARRLKAAAEKAAADAAAAEDRRQAALLETARLAKQRFDEQQAQARADAAARKAAADKAARDAKNPPAGSGGGSGGSGSAGGGSSGGTVFYPTCADALNAGVAPIRRGDPGYRAALDTNGNGLACEILPDPGGGGGGGGSNSGGSAPPPPSGGSGGWTAAKGRDAVASVERWLGTPYSWGGGSSSGPTSGICGPDGAFNDCNIVGFDCSGLTSYGWAQEGISIVALSAYQYDVGQHVASGDLMPGDLMFYANNTSDPGTIHHVSMYAGNGEMVEAPFSGSYVHLTGAEFGNGYIGATRPGT